jgi:hypothetical protein
LNFFADFAASSLRSLRLKSLNAPGKPLFWNRQTATRPPPYRRSKIRQMRLTPWKDAAAMAQKWREGNCVASRVSSAKISGQKMILFPQPIA